MSLNLFFFVGLLVVPLARWLIPPLREGDLWRTIASSVGGAFVCGVAAAALSSEDALDGSVGPFGVGFAVLGASVACVVRAQRLRRESTLLFGSFTLLHGANAPISAQWRA